MCLSNCNPAPLSNGHLSNFLWRSATVTPEWKTSVAGTWSILPCKHSVMILIFHSRITVAFLHKKLDNVQFPTDYQSSLLHYACWNGGHDLSRKLVDKYQCDPYPENKWKYTPLHWACKGGSMDKETLLECFYDHESTATDKEWALRLLSRHPYPERVRKIRDLVDYWSDHDQTWQCLRRHSYYLPHFISPLEICHHFQTQAKLFSVHQPHPYQWRHPYALQLMTQTCIVYTPRSRGYDSSLGTKEIFFKMAKWVDILLH